MDKRIKTHKLEHTPKENKETKDTSLVEELGKDIKDLFGEVDPKHTKKHNCFGIDIAIMVILGVLIVWAICRKK